MIMYLLNSAGFKSCTTAWNVGESRLLNLPNTTHTWLLGPLLDSVHMTYKLYIRDLKCIYCMRNNDNDLVSLCFEYVSSPFAVVTTYMSSLGRQL